MEQTITLKNGSVEFQPLVKITMLSLEKLMLDKPILFYELVMKARDSKHVFFGNSADDLKSLNLIHNDETLHESIRNIIVSATEGDGLDMKLVSPH